ncbi:hypothetical protein ACFV6G_00770 [Streptomyces lavendulae]|uniref:hypothetical protein n=1 Tax=Streptomyces lavendulae TaxID=1914 RepID=UPI0036AA363D
MLDELASYVLGVGRRDALTDAFAGHPRNPQVILCVVHANEVADVDPHLSGLSSAAHLGLSLRVNWMVRLRKFPAACLKQAMPIRVKVEERPAEQDWTSHFWFGTHNVLDDPRNANSVQSISGRPQKVRVIVLPDPLCLAVELTRRRGVYEVETVAVRQKKLHRFGLNKLKWITRL